VRTGSDPVRAIRRLTAWATLRPPVKARGGGLPVTFLNQPYLMLEGDFVIALVKFRLGSENGGVPSNQKFIT